MSTKQRLMIYIKTSRIKMNITSETLKKLTISELVDYYKASKILVDYYVNEAKTNEVYKNIKDKEEYFKTPNRKVFTYTCFSKLIIGEIENRISGENNTEDI